MKTIVKFIAKHKTPFIIIVILVLLLNVDLKCSLSSFLGHSLVCGLNLF